MQCCSGDASTVAGLKERPSVEQRGMGRWEGQGPDLLIGLPKLCSSLALTKMLVGDDDDEGDSNH